MSIFEILPIVVSDFSQNCRIIADTASRQAVIIDPGGEVEKISRCLSEAGLVASAIWLTHSHLDHAGAVAELKKKFNIPLYANPIEKLMRQKMPEIAAMYGLPKTSYPICPEPDHEITGGETLKVGDIEFKVLFTPGHSPGHVCFYSSGQNALIAGDLVFAGSVGRTDLPGGDHKVLLQSIITHILPLPNGTNIFPGHGDNTTVGEERHSNPFFPRGNT